MLQDTANPRPLLSTAMGGPRTKSGLGFTLTQSLPKLKQGWVGDTEITGKGKVLRYDKAFSFSYEWDKIDKIKCGTPSGGSISATQAISR